MTPAFQHILVATDAQPLADAALRLALAVSGTARITALLVVHDYGFLDYARSSLGGRADAIELRKQILDEGTRQLADALQRAAVEARRFEPAVVLSDESPAQQILATAEREGCDLIVMAAHGHGGLATLGSQTQRVLEHAKVPVLVAR